MRVRPSPKTDLATVAGRDRLLVLVEDLDLPAGHRLAHRALANLHERVVGDERIRLRQAVVVEHRDSVVLSEPANRLGVQWLARRADPAGTLRVARPRIVDRHHGPHRRGRREDVRHVVAAQEVELPMRIESGLAPVDALHRSEPPRAQKRRDPCGPRPLAHAVKPLAVGDLVAVHELLVAQDVAVGVHDALRQPGRPRRVVSCAGSSAAVSHVRGSVEAPTSVSASSTQRWNSGVCETRSVRRVGDDARRAPESERRCDRVVAVEHRHREQDCAELPDAEEDGGGLRRRW